LNELEEKSEKRRKRKRRKEGEARRQTSNSRVHSECVMFSIESTKQ
jgi:hypothetical protein